MALLNELHMCVPSGLHEHDYDFVIHVKITLQKKAIVPHIYIYIYITYRNEFILIVVN